MHEAALVARLVLAAVLLSAGAAKVAAPGNPAAVADSLGLGRRLVPLVRVATFAEITLGAALLPAASARFSAAASAGLLVAFTALLLRGLARGRRVSCNCFGALHDGAAGWSSIARNATLLAASAVVVLTPGPLGAPLAAAGAVVLLAMGAGLLARYLATVPGRRPVAPQEPVPGSPTVLAFVDPTCGPCRSAIPVLQRWWESGLTPGLTVVTRGGPPQNGDLLEAVPESRVVYDNGRQMALRYGVTGTPSAVLVDPGEGESHTVVTGAAAIDLLLRRVAEAGAPSRRHVRGAAPAAGARATVATGPGVLDAVSRREMLAGGGTGALAVLAAACGGSNTGSSGTTLAGSTSTGSATSTTTGPTGTLPPGQSGIGCPRCGSCTVCEIVPGTNGANATLDCRQCKDACSTSKLCSQYATQNSDYLALASTLVAQGGYQPSGDPWAAGLEQGGNLQVLSLVTQLTSSTATDPKALLVYSLSTAEVAFALTVGSDGRFTQALVVDSNGQVVSVPTPSDFSTSTTTTAAILRQLHGDGGAGAPGAWPAGAWPAGEEIVLDAASCSDKCELASNLMLLAVTLPFIGPEEAAIAMGQFLLGNAFPSDSTAGAWISLIQSVLGIADLMNSLEVLKGAAVSQFCSLACGGQGFLHLKGCCNYSGACFDSDAQCEANCPGGLAHPMAHCDVYVNGHKVSQVIPGGL